MLPWLPPTQISSAILTRWTIVTAHNWYRLCFDILVVRRSCHGHLETVHCQERQGKFVFNYSTAVMSLVPLKVVALKFKILVDHRLVFHFRSISMVTTCAACTKQCHVIFCRQNWAAREVLTNVASGSKSWRVDNQKITSGSNDVPAEYEAPAPWHIYYNDNLKCS